MSKPLRSQIEDAIQRASDAIHNSTDWWDGYDRGKPIIEELLDTIMEAVGRDSERWQHAKADFLVASEVDAIEARIDAGISARKETT